MRYADFALFLLAEEDKQSDASVQYWFHVLDYDGDGVIGTADMRYFYEEQQRRLEAMGEEVRANPNPKPNPNPNPNPNPKP